MGGLSVSRMLGTCCSSLVLLFFQLSSLVASRASSAFDHSAEKETAVVPIQNGFNKKVGGHTLFVMSLLAENIHDTVLHAAETGSYN